MKSLNLDILEKTVKELEPLSDEVVFVGGATISLFIKEPQFVTIRPTQDVDCVVEVLNRGGFEDFSKKLRSIGFNEDMHSLVTCRFKKGPLLLDVMATESSVLSFTNKWYKEGFENSISQDVDGIKIKTFDVSYMLASKIEAFKGRGNGDFLVSHDIEDIITLFDGRSSIAEDVLKSNGTVREYLVTEFTSLLSDKSFVQSIEGHIADRANSKGRKEIVLERIKKIIT